MDVSDISLDGIKSLTAFLQRLPQGAAARELGSRLGLWSTQLHTSGRSGRRIFPTSFSEEPDTGISDLNAYWNSEVFRATEITGLLEGQKAMLSLQSKAVRAKARSRIRRHHQRLREEAAQAGQPVPKEPTAGQLSDEVEAESDVQAQDELLTLLILVLEQAKAYKEACLNAAASVSREISFRQAQMGSRLR